MPRTLFFMFFMFLAGCGCSESASSPADVEAGKRNDRSLAAAMERAGLVSAGPAKSDMGGPSMGYVTEIKVVTTNGVSMVVFPANKEAPVIVRDRNGKLHDLEVTHEVASTRTSTSCGCGPNVGGGTPPPQPPTYFFPLDSPDAWGGHITIVARGWTEFSTNYPNANDHMCREIP